MDSQGKLVKPEKECEDTVDSIIQQAFGKDPFLSFSRSGENPVQLIQLLNALDQQGHDKASGSSKLENCIQGEDNSVGLCNGTGSFLSEINGNGHKESNHSLKANGIPVKGGMSTSEQMQSLKFPEAVIAFAQAAAKANDLPGWPLLSPPKVQLQKCSKCSQEFCSSINYRRHTRVHRRPLNVVKDSSKTRKLLGTFWDKLSVDEAKEIVSFQNASLEEVTGSSIVRALSSCVRKLGFTSLPQTYVKSGVTLLDVVQARPSSFPISSQELFSALDDASEKTFLCSGTALSVQKYVFDGEVGKTVLEMKNLIACTSFLLEKLLVKAWVADKDAEALRCQKLLVEEEEAAQKRQAVLLERKRLKKLRQKQQKARELSDGKEVDSKVSLLDSAEGSSGFIATSSPRSPLESGLNTSEASLDQDPSSLDLMDLREVDSDANLRPPLHSEYNISDHWKPVASQHVLPKQTRKSLNSVTRHGKSVPLSNGHKVWTPKFKEESEDGWTNESGQPDELVSNMTKVMIGSISVALGDGDIQEKLVRSDSSRAAVKLWRPVSCCGSENSAEVNGVASIAADQVSSGMDCLGSGNGEVGDAENCKCSVSMHTSRDLSAPMLFSREVAEVFLAQRWRKAMASDHVKLVLSPENSQSDGLETPVGAQSAGHNARVILGSAENWIVGAGSIEPASAFVSKPKFRPKNIEKGFRLKYVPKKSCDGIRE